MVIQYTAEVHNIGQDFPDGFVELMLTVERLKTKAWLTIFVDEETLKQENIKKGDKLLINLSKKLKY